jgi:predicted nucleic acid-binding Zn ribbon protein
LVADVLRKALGQKLSKRIYSIDLVRRRWASVVGEELARRAEPEALADGVLTVRVADPVWGRTILKLQGRILSGLNGALGQNLVRRINFTRRDHVGSDGSEIPEARPAKPQARAPESVLRAAEAIRDEQTRALVTKSAARYLQAQEERRRK